MTSLGLSAVLLASLLGSVHCVAMCGGFAVAAAGRGRRASAVAYQLGRLLGYVALGAGAGLVGAGLDVAGQSLVGVQRVAGWLTGAVLVAMAVAALLPSRTGAGEPLVTLGTAPARGGRLRRGVLGGLRRGDAVGAGFVGLGSALLPCGWLWGYVLVAASTGAAATGALVMLAFWAGAVPALASVGVLAGWLRRRLGRHAPRLAAVVMLVLGILALAGKLSPAPVADDAPPSCPHHSP